MTPEQAKALRAPFPPEQIGKLPRITCQACSKKNCTEHQKRQCAECGNYISTQHIHLDYVGHAAVTDRLLQVDPEWGWRPPNREEHATLPQYDDGMWIMLTVAGVTRPGFGDGKNAKEMISDAIRNAAMRFGVALDLWSKQELQPGYDDAPGRKVSSRGSHPPREEAGPSAATQDGPADVLRVKTLAARVKNRGLDEWVKDQNFPWPWESDVCDAIEAKLADDEAQEDPF